ncbi:MAG: four helix bundle protein [Prevotella sp.]|nr:four helix bundle protein [Prevotella sp.]
MDNFRDFMYNKCLNFSVRMVKLGQYLQTEKHDFVISKQIVRSGTSIGANLAEAQYGSSLKDFLAKCYISLRESSETLYWLEILRRTELISEEQHTSLYRDCEELKKLLVSITATTKKKIDEQNNKS